jgi:CBS domain containing-hemolysin-like protein
VGGLVSALAGRVPQRGEVIAHPDGLEFEITDADPRRIKRVRVRPTILAAAADTPEAGA